MRTGFIMLLRYLLEKTENKLVKTGYIGYKSGYTEALLLCSDFKPVFCGMIQLPNA